MLCRLFGCIPSARRCSSCQRFRRFLASSAAQILRSPSAICIDAPDSIWPPRCALHLLVLCFVVASMRERTAERWMWQQFSFASAARRLFRVPRLRSCFAFPRWSLNAHQIIASPLGCVPASRPSLAAAAPLPPPRPSAVQCNTTTGRSNGNGEGHAEHTQHKGRSEHTHSDRDERAVEISF